ncbi:MAG: dihydroxy-acid dehydratase, partial [Gammaproteobacteria bacterium]|nr:dihydroxy-acid dehydratase [Gammaproteobacteria bacterium]
RTTESLDKDVLRPVAEAFRTDGGLKLVKGNLGRAIVKVSAVDPSQQVIKAPAIVFRSQQDFVEQFNAGKLKRDFIAVLTHQGPQSNGMPELHQLTPMLSALQSQGFVVALVTDGRMSGASGKIPAAIHLSPEAQSGGAIAKIKSGDLIELDCLSGRLNVICEDDFENRPIDSTSPESNTQFHQYGWGTELFSGFRQQVSSAEEGATIFSLNNTSNHGNPS